MISRGRTRARASVKALPGQIGSFVRREGFFASLLISLLIAQSIHMVEHFAQIYQIHLLASPGSQAHGLAGAVLDTEWLHFVFNTGALVGLVLVAVRWPRVGWILLAVAIGTWHEAEHDVIIDYYLRYGAAGFPGLLAHGGVLWPSSPLTRPDLHFIYNLAETAALYCGCWRILTRRVACSSPAFAVPVAAQ